jgi:hypothetical protein
MKAAQLFWKGRFQYAQLLLELRDRKATHAVVSNMK